MKRKGSALLVVVIIMFFVFLMAAIMVQMTIRSRVNSKSDINDTNAYYSAEAGVNNTINYLSTLTSTQIDSYIAGSGTNRLSKTNVFDNSSNYQVEFKFTSKSSTVSPASFIVFNIKSIGTYGVTSYTIDTQVQLEWNTTKARYQFSKFISKKAYKAL